MHNRENKTRNKENIMHDRESKMRDRENKTRDRKKEMRDRESEIRTCANFSCTKLISRVDETSTSTREINYINILTYLFILKG